MVSRDRWREAQKYERSFWEGWARRVEAGATDFSWYQWKSDHCVDVLTKASNGSLPRLGELSVLEVGSGPVGIVAHLRAKTRTAIDPLCDVYASLPALSQFRSPEVTYLQGQAEAIPSEAGAFDMVIIDNVIDHVHNAESVMREIHRVLKPGGWLYFTVNLHPPFGAFKHEILARLKIDRGHPYTFTLKKVRRFLGRCGFTIMHDEWQDYGESRAKDLASASAKDRVKGILGLSEFLYTAACRRSD